MKDAFSQLKQHYFTSSSRRNNLNLPDVIVKQNEIKPYEKITTELDELVKQEDPLLLRINKKPINYFAEYYSDKTLSQSIKIKLVDYLIEKNYINQKRFWSLKTTPYVYTKTPNYSYYFSKYHFFSKKIIGLAFLFNCYVIGYTLSRIKYDAVFRRFGYSKFPTFMNDLQNFNILLENIDDYIEDYFPRDMDETELHYIWYKKYIDMKMKRNIENNLKKVDFLDKDIVEIDNMLKNMR